ncbi:MAG: aromatic ring-hydroxylating dioxygenase subunit alpha [Candidatus Nanopelagicales bacterium]
MRVGADPARVPLGAAVASYPVTESDGLVWVWFGEPGRARLHRVPELPWLAGDGWATVGGEADVDAGFLLLHENFADVTQVPFVAPEISPEVLAAAPPPLDVVVTETTVALRREFPPAPLPGWQADLLGVPVDEERETVQEAFFVSPAAWVDHWDVRSGDDVARLRFTQLVTPLDERRSRVLWRVSRDFAVGDASATDRLTAMFGSYYDRVMAAMETAQRVLDTDGPGPEVNVSADVAALKVREIVGAMLAEEGAVAPWQRGRRLR